MSQVFGGRHEPGNERAKMLAMKAAYFTPSADTQIGVEVPEGLPVTNHLFAQTGRENALVGETADAVERDRERWVAVAGRDGVLLPTGGASLVDQCTGSGIDLSGSGGGIWRGFRFEHGLDVCLGVLHAGSVGQ